MASNISELYRNNSHPQIKGHVRLMISMTATDAAADLL
jgi:hypothetical protein